MCTIDFLVIALYFLGLIGVSIFMSRRIKSSEDMFIAGRNSSWWLSGMSTYMTIFSASTFVIWGGVAYRSGVVAALVGTVLGTACLFVGKYLAGRWRAMRIKSPGEFIAIRFGKRTVNFYTVLGIIGRGAHTSVSLYAIAVVVSTLIHLPAGNPLADPATGCLSVQWACLILGAIALLYTVLGGFLAVLMTDVIQFGVLMSIVLFMVPLSLIEVGGIGNFVEHMPEGFFVPVSAEYPWEWMVLWLFINFFTLGGDWPFVQRYISIPTAKGAKKSCYLVFALYLFTPIIWYFPAMAYRMIDPTANPEQAYMLMSEHVLMKGMLGVMLAAMVSATLSTVSGVLNVFANVFTYDIYCARHPETSEKKRISVGRKFTLIFGLSLLALALLIPYAGGAEKFVVTILTLVIGPIYIPSVWGVFSKYITGKQVIWSMVITYAIGMFFKFYLGEIYNRQLMEAVAGLLVPLAIIAAMDVWSRLHRHEDEGFSRIKELADPDPNREPSPEMKRAAKNYSFLAVNYFTATISCIAAMLLVLVAVEDFTPSVRSTMICSASIMLGLTLIYIIYRIIDRIHTSKS